MAKYRYSAEPLAVPATGIAFQIDTARWTLRSGRVWLQEPTADGRVAGLVFEGSGRFEMQLPDPVELRQLRGWWWQG